MAINQLYGYDTGLYGYGGANGVDPTRKQTQYAARAYPAWMTDLNARGIGEANANNITRPGVIDIPRYYGPPSGQAPGAADYGAYVGYGGPGGTVSQSEGGLGNPQGNPGTGSPLSDARGMYDALTTGASYDGLRADIGSLPGKIADFFGVGMDGAGAYGDAPAGGPQQGGTGEMAAGTAEAAATGGQFGMAKGGLVTRNRLAGPNPPGPDDGFAALDEGEGVLTAKALRHYGPSIVAKINRLAVPKGAFGGK